MAHVIWNGAYDVQLCLSAAAARFDTRASASPRRAWTAQKGGGGMGQNGTAITHQR